MGTKADESRDAQRPAQRPVRYAEVAIDRPLATPLHYRLSPEFAETCRPGMRVAVPLGPRREVGVVVGLADESPIDPKRVREVLAVLDPEPIVDSGLLELTAWMSAEYACSHGEALAAILPAPLKRERAPRRLLEIRASPEAAANLAPLEEKAPQQYRLLRTLIEIEGWTRVADLVRKLDVARDGCRALERKGLAELRSVEQDGFEMPPEDVARFEPERLSRQQAEALSRLEMGLDLGGGAYLLHGVTGSGKTEVYLRTIASALERGRSAIVLVPEIALTPQTVGWFRSRFGEIAVLHSRMTDGQRLHAFRRLRSGEVRVAVGARSAIFAPVRDLGVIVLDEEHEPTFKQNNVPRYHAREVAIERGRRAGAVVVLGSATPSLESFEATRAGKLQHILLTERVGGGRLPKIGIVDMRTEPQDKFGAIFSRQLRQELVTNLKRREQSILFLNRRGHSPVLWCHACRNVARCPDCTAPFTWHRRIDRLVCHQCAREERVPKECPACTAPGLRMLGVGSERVERALRALLPTARIARMDSDTMHRQEDYQRVLSAFGRGELDCLVGTQMIAKGLDFPRVTLVGIVSADTSLHLPDFRAAERTYQLLSQVSGRAGRSELEGRILIQTETPEHAAIRAAQSHDYNAFAEAELDLRREMSLPPFGRLLRLVFEDEDAARAANAAVGLCTRLRESLASLPEGEPRGVLLGPVPAPLALLRGRHRHHALFKTPFGATAFDRVRELALAEARSSGRTRLLVDVDPMAMM